jgi:hypothetical protein
MTDKERAERAWWFDLSEWRKQRGGGFYAT